ncbi:winged helix-turn-helix transcriptional regulator [Arenibaculum pallidiluteum]|uniref:winged helix-turn-helix transcriptional regulator n=1 Tax=Arenibaculum pallidiluteum TaxID=2812559 RepID=UPI001A96987E|nr:helix-turn-helix domain-containing protein [Arenibaculum pallidiluteum]
MRAVEATEPASVADGTGARAGIGAGGREPCAYGANCPTRQALDRIADKWTVLILGLLRNGPMRFNRLRREIEGISQKMLAQTLRSLERDGLVSRRAYATVPVTVEYAITPLGATLAETLTPLIRWAEANIDKVEKARTDYDRVQAAAMEDGAAGTIAFR